jgi:uncharacterized protein
VATTTTPTRGAKSDMPEPNGRRVRAVLRSWLRSLHRDAGYLAVGLTFVYAISGLAVNHIKDWDPNFRQIERTSHVATPLPEDDSAAATKIATDLGIKEAPREVYRASESALEVVFDKRTLHVDTRTGTVHEDGEEPRFFLRLANWLHLNRGKKAWSYIADGYAVFLLFLASSGLFMIPGRKGLVGRGAVLVGLGMAVPILYVVLSGGP